VLSEASAQIARAQSAGSRFRISAVARNTNGFDLTFASIAGKTYRVETKDSVLLPNWTLFSDQIFATGTSTTISDPGAAGLAQRFYRATIEP